MRGHALFAAVAGLALGGSIAHADFILSSTRVVNGDGTDTVTFKVTQNGQGVGAVAQPNLTSFDIALIAPTTGYPGATSANGLIIQTDGSGPGGTSGQAVISSTTSVPGGSYIKLPSAQWISPGANILTSRNTGVTTGTVDAGAANTYNNGDKVGGIGGAFGLTSATSFGVSTIGGLVIAVAVVPTGGPVGIAQTTSNGDVPGTRTNNTNFEFAGTEFTAENASGTHNRVIVAPKHDLTGGTQFWYIFEPEPSTLGVLSLGLGGLIARRRRL